MPHGLVRSTAIAFTLLYRGLPPARDRTKSALDLRLQLRPQAKPNRLVLELGLAQSLPLSEARQVVEVVLSDPRVQDNRFRSVEL